MILATALGMATERIKFLVAVRSGLYSPTLFAQQVNTLSVLTGGRVGLNFVNGHSDKEQRYYGDFLDREQRYARTDEFLDICRALWAGHCPVTYSGKHFQVEGAVLNTPFRAPQRTEPELYVGGSSAPAVRQACKYDACLLTTPASPEQLTARLAPLHERQGRAGLIVALIARATRNAALVAARICWRMPAPKRTWCIVHSVHSRFRSLLPAHSIVRSNANGSPLRCGREPSLFLAPRQPHSSALTTRLPTLCLPMERVASPNSCFSDGQISMR